MYDGTIRNVTIIMGTFGAATTITFLLRHLVLGASPEPSEEIIGPDH